MAPDETARSSDPDVIWQHRLLDAHRKAERELERGNIEAATDMCRELLDTYPGQPGLWATLAATEAEKGAYDRAVTCLEKAVSIRRAFAPYLRLLGKAYRRVGRTRDAVEAFEKAAFIEPKNAEGQLELAVVGFETGDVDKGRRSLAKAASLALHGALGRSLYSMALCVRGLGYLVVATVGRGGSFRRRLSHRIAADYLRHDRYDEAERRYRALLDANGEDCEALAGLGRALMAQNRNPEAEWYLKRAETLDPDNREIQLDIASVCYRRLHLDEACARLRSILDEVRQSVRANSTMGWVLLQMGSADQALAHFQACLDVAADDADACFGMAQCYQAIGEFEQSKDWLKRTLSYRDDHTAAIQSLVKIEKSKGEEVRLETLLSLLKRDHLPREHRIQLHFAIAAIEDGKGNIDSAFEHYSRANALKDVAFDGDMVSRQAERMIDIFSSEKLDALAGFGETEGRPIFIVGMPRSGSTLIEQVLASHPEVAGGGEMLHMPARLRAFRAQCPVDDGDPDYMHRLDGAAIQAIAMGYLQDIDAVGEGRLRVTDKLLSNVWNLGVIALAFPNACIVHAHRDPLDCCSSIYMRDFASVHSYAYDQRNLGRYYRIQQKLMDYWKTVLPMGVIEVQYEDIVADPESEIRKLLKQCGLEWDARCLEFHKTQRNVSTASFAQVRVPIYRSAVGKSARYEKHLQPLRDALCAD